MLPPPWNLGPPPFTGHFLVCYQTHDHPGSEYFRAVHVHVLLPDDAPTMRVDADDRVRLYSTHFGPGLGDVGHVIGWCEPTGANFDAAFDDVRRRFEVATEVGRARAAELRESSQGT